MTIPEIDEMRTAGSGKLVTRPINTDNMAKFAAKRGKVQGALQYSLGDQFRAADPHKVSVK